MTGERGSTVSTFLRRATSELAIVFVGVLAALWVDARQEASEQKDRALDIASAMYAEIVHLTTWFGPWRASVDSAYREWQDRVAAGDRPAPFYFRMPGAEQTPKVGWDAGVATGLLDTFDPALVFDVGNMYHEWHEIGARVARYHASTEVLVFPAVADPGMAWRQAGETPSGGITFSVGDPTVEPGGLREVRIVGGLRPEYAANLALMEEVLREMDDKYAWAERIRVQLDSAIAHVR